MIQINNRSFDTARFSTPQQLATQMAREDRAINITETAQALTKVLGLSQPTNIIKPASDIYLSFHKGANKPFTVVENFLDNGKLPKPGSYKFKLARPQTLSIPDKLPKGLAVDLDELSYRIASLNQANDDGEKFKSAIKGSKYEARLLEALGYNTAAMDTTAILPALLERLTDAAKALQAHNEALAQRSFFLEKTNLSDAVLLPEGWVAIRIKTGDNAGRLGYIQSASTNAANGSLSNPIWECPRQVLESLPPFVRLGPNSINNSISFYSTIGNQTRETLPSQDWISSHRTLANTTTHGALLVNQELEVFNTKVKASESFFRGQSVSDAIREIRLEQVGIHTPVAKSNFRKLRSKLAKLQTRIEQYSRKTIDSANTANGSKVVSDFSSHKQYSALMKIVAKHFTASTLEDPVTFQTKLNEFHEAIESKDSYIARAVQRHIKKEIVLATRAEKQKEFNSFYRRNLKIEIKLLDYDHDDESRFILDQSGSEGVCMAQSLRWIQEKGNPTQLTQGKVLAQDLMLQSLIKLELAAKTKGLQGSPDRRKYLESLSQTLNIEEQNKYLIRLSQGEIVDLSGCLPSLHRYEQALDARNAFLQNYDISDVMILDNGWIAWLPESGDSVGQLCFTHTASPNHLVNDMPEKVVPFGVQVVSNEGKIHLKFGNKAIARHRADWLEKIPASSEQSSEFIMQLKSQEKKCLADYETALADITSAQKELDSLFMYLPKTIRKKMGLTTIKRQRKYTEAAEVAPAILSLFINNPANLTYTANDDCSTESAYFIIGLTKEPNQQEQNRGHASALKITRSKGSDSLDTIDFFDPNCGGYHFKSPQEFQEFLPQWEHAFYAASGFNTIHLLEAPPVEE